MLLRLIQKSQDRYASSRHKKSDFELEQAASAAKTEFTTVAATTKQSYVDLNNRYLFYRRSQPPLGGHPHVLFMNSTLLSLSLSVPSLLLSPCMCVCVYCVCVCG